MSDNRQGETTYSSTETWACGQCGIQLSGVPVAKRSALPQVAKDASVFDYIQSKCAECGSIMCGQCIDLQKPDERFRDEDIPCPECGTLLGDSSVLVPEQWSAQHGIGETEDEELDFTGDLKSWSGWVIFWTVLNFFATGSIIVKAQRSPDFDPVFPTVMLGFFLRNTLAIWTGFLRQGCEMAV